MEKTLNRLCLIKNNLKNIEKLSIIPFETPQSPEKALEIQKKSLENSLIFNGFYKKPFKERINQVNLFISSVLFFPFL